MGSCDARAGRRTLLKGGIGLAIGLCLTPSGSGQDNPAAIRPQEGDLLVKVEDAGAMPLTPADIPLAGAQTMAWAMDPAGKTIRSGSRLDRVLLLRVDLGQLSEETT